MTMPFSSSSQGLSPLPHSLPPRPIKKLINQVFSYGSGTGKVKVAGGKSLGLEKIEGDGERKSGEYSSYRSYEDNVDLYPVIKGQRPRRMGTEKGWNDLSRSSRTYLIPLSKSTSWQKSLSDGNLEKSSSSDWVFGRTDDTSTEKNGIRTRIQHPPEKDQQNQTGFFRSISLRNLLQIGGMNKSRSGGQVQIKKVAPPTAPVVPGLVSFASFRVKKGQSSRECSSSTLSGESSDKQRYSASSLGSTGSSYTTNSSSSSSSDNQNPFGTEDGFLLPPPNHYVLKDLDEGVYSDGTTSNGFKNSVSFDTFPSYSTPTGTPTLEMHQNIYGKLNSGGGGGTGSKMNGHAGQPHHIQQQAQEGHFQLNPNQHPNTHVYTHHPQNQTLINHYQTQISIEDQGIDMTQSPGRESPSSTASSNTGSGSGSAVGSVSSGSGSGGSNNGCRHSTSSFDSGRASGSTIYQQGVRYSGLSSESSSGSFRHSYHSSNSSLGSIAPEDICNFDVSAMISQGIPEHEVLNAWLTGVHFECYYQNFIQAGYDIHTISRMTPEDLNAIGVTKPHHRKRLKAEISQLALADGLLDYIPSSIEEWLGHLRLDEYTPKLKAQGYHNVRQVTNITWEDLEDIGILKLGHQKKFMLAIKRVEDILAGKRVQQPQPPLQPSSTYASTVQQQQDSYPQRLGSQPSAQHQMQQSGHPSLPYSHPLHHHHQQQQMLMNASSGNGGYPYATRVVPASQHSILHHRHPQSGIYGQTMSVLTHQPQIHHHQEEHREYQPEVISIHVKNSGRRRSMENIAMDEPIYGTSSFLPQSQPQQTAQNWQRSSAKGTYELQDGDTTPTNEMQGFHNAPSTSTLPRLLKNKPIAKIMSGSDRNSIAPPTSCAQASGGQPYGGAASDGYKSLPRDIGRKGGISEYAGGNSYSLAYGNFDGITKVPQGNTKNPPPPPTRRGSAPGESIYGPLSTFQGNTGGYAGWTTHFPPPPPALSCDVPYGSPGKMSLDDLPLPPHPEELVISQTQQLPQSSSLNNGTSTPSSSSSSPNNPVKMVTTSSVVHYHPNSRTSPQNVKSRDPSPVGSDFSDSDLPNNGLMARGVRRNGSDASFKSNSSTESESIPFANDNAGTIKQQKANNRATAQLVAAAATSSSSSSSAGTGDVLNDIGNMLADLTDELDAILEQEIKSKR